MEQSYTGAFGHRATQEDADSGLKTLHTALRKKEGGGWSSVVKDDEIGRRLIEDGYKVATVLYAVEVPGASIRDIKQVEAALKAYGIPSETPFSSAVLRGMESLTVVVSERTKNSLQLAFGRISPASRG